MRALAPPHQALALSLAVLAGYVDSLGFLHLGGVFVSFMSGNSTRLAASLAEGQWTAALGLAGILILFVMGSFCGALIARGQEGRSRSRVLAFEGVLLTLAVPLALYMAKVASPAVRVALVVAVTTPLWASYLVKAYAWRMLLSPEGPMHWAIGYSPGYGLIATVITLTYLWLPYMVIPVFAAFQRVPDSLVDASADLGASDLTTLRLVVSPMVFPGIAAGSIFTFSLSLGDYIAVTIVGGKTQLLGNVIYGQLVTANNQPMAAALSLIPLTAILLYLFAMRRTGALENV